VNQKREIKPPTRGELRLAVRQTAEARRERDAALIQLENADKLLNERGVDRLVEDCDRLRSIAARVKSELESLCCETLCHGPELLARWRRTLADEIGEALAKGGAPA